MRIGLIGAGNMATALARGWGDPVLVHDAYRPRAEALVAELGGCLRAMLRDVLCGHLEPELRRVADTLLADVAPMA